MTRIFIFHTVGAGKSFVVIHLAVISHFRSIHISLFIWDYELRCCIHGLAHDFSHLHNCPFGSCKPINYAAVAGFFANSLQIEGCRVDDTSSSDFPSLITAKQIDIAAKPVETHARTVAKPNSPLKPIPAIAPMMNARLYNMSYAAKTCPIFDFETFA